MRSETERVFFGLGAIAAAARTVYEADLRFRPGSPSSPRSAVLGCEATLATAAADDVRSPEVALLEPRVKNDDNFDCFCRTIGITTGVSKVKYRQSKRAICFTRTEENLGCIPAASDGVPNLHDTRKQCICHFRLPCRQIAGRRKVPFCR